MKRWDVKQDSIYLARCILAALGVVVAWNSPMVKLPPESFISIFLVWFGLCIFDWWKYLPSTKSKV